MPYAPSRSYKKKKTPKPNHLMYASLIIFFLQDFLQTLCMNLKKFSFMRAIYLAHLRLNDMTA
jgi:hypothetical protein